MNPPRPHRKRIRHYDDFPCIHELTFSCFQRRPLLTNDLWRQMLGQSIDRAIESHRYRLAALIFMPEHVHLVVYPLDGASKIADLLRAIKRPYSFRIKKLLENAHSPLLEQLTIRQRPGVTTFRFRQEGPGYDRNVTEVATALEVIDYIHLNPVKRGLVPAATDWRWSSVRFYHDASVASDADLPIIHGLPAGFLD